ncbi:Ni/Fe-hydrogenase, b-type cytochrome subunit [Rhodopseudomonas pseudopalustris]|uniref:Probable Ni/Fe-hydrogenase B-type cytochrome subunit n=2 Tax=Rhodopseudomonas TaxID=1073 RepID=Q13BY7_RHOPS|nr:Ni/Fe-hydrogenase, b-type cytochrome subunit [Rhodopseudomonas pseudopalustris]ABE38402.1 Nickel-dependent hydrogenase b-type cytochrome subunit [Rhodopseudomonas palustris BisB5]MBB1094392.1 Ni/Fe-hydrogenase, b-type cytochrome subunit [Rhodopseudomonas palustris]SEO30410.1 Ni/Fe-hydrogenase 1 B-type cytochrome subunit [Rhodopseudomonas pseudopalustris]
MTTEIARVQGALDSAGERARSLQTVYVYQAPVRLWHWVNALLIVVLCVTGYFIGTPLPSVPGEASASFQMGYIRFAHFAAGQTLIVFFLLRVYWAFVGNKYSKQIFWLPITNKTWWWGMLYELKWYLFLVRDPKKYIGHNPLAHVAMFSFMVFMVLMILSGMALYSEGHGIDSWQYKLFGFMFAIFPNGQTLHTLHHLGMWAIVVFVVVHIYAAVREDILSRQSMISSIVSGERLFRDDLPD